MAASFSLLVPFCLLVPLFAPAAKAQQIYAPQQADTTSIIAQLRNGSPDAALRETQQLLKRFPGDCRLWSLQAVAQQTLKQPQAALKNFRHAIALCPTSLAALEGAAQLEYAAHDPAAITHLGSILAQHPGDPVSSAMLASLLAARGQCTQALPHFVASKPIFSTQPALVAAYGACLLQTANYSDAVEVFTQLQAAQPGSEATRDLAFAQWKSGKPQAALTTLQPLIDAGTDAESLTLASSIAEDNGDTMRSVALLRQAILLQPKNVDNYLAFARLAQSHKSYQVGIDIIDAGLRVLPAAAPLYVARGVLLVQLSQTATAIADFEHAHQLDPKLSTALDAVGVLDEQQHNDAASLALFRKQAALHPNDALLQFLLAESLSEQSSDGLKEAISAAGRASDLEPTYGPALDLLATLCLRQSDYARAVRVAEQALVLDPNDVPALFTELRAKSRLGDNAAIPALTRRLAEARNATQAEAGKEARYRLTDK